jgi:hypothetical protein
MKALSVISGFQRDVDEICALLGYYTPSNGNPLRTFRETTYRSHLQGSRSPRRKGIGSLDPLDLLTLEDWTDTSRNVGKGLQFNAA